MMLQDDEFYMEDGKFVLTERYHWRRGHCCGNGCRHCPYSHESVPLKMRGQKEPPRPYYPDSKPEFGKPSTP